MGSIPVLGRSPGGGHGNPLKYSCLENPMDRGVWQTTVHAVEEWTGLKQLSMHAQHSTIMLSAYSTYLTSDFVYIDRA